MNEIRKEALSNAVAIRQGARRSEKEIFHVEKCTVECSVAAVTVQHRGCNYAHVMVLLSVFKLSSVIISSYFHNTVLIFIAQPVG